MQMTFLPDLPAINVADDIADDVVRTPYTASNSV